MCTKFDMYVFIAVSERVILNIIQDQCDCIVKCVLSFDRKEVSQN
jgi:hypothetical protein